MENMTELPKDFTCCIWAHVFLPLLELTLPSACPVLTEGWSAAITSPSPTHSLQLWSQLGLLKCAQCFQLCPWLSDAQQLPVYLQNVPIRLADVQERDTPEACFNIVLSPLTTKLYVTPTTHTKPCERPMRRGGKGNVHNHSTSRRCRKTPELVGLCRGLSGLENWSQLHRDSEKI